MFVPGLQCCSLCPIWFGNHFAEEERTGWFTVNSEIFARILFSRIALKAIFTSLKLTIRAWFTNISQLQNDFNISRGFHFHETS